MKTLRRAIAVGTVAAFATVAFTVQAPADHTDARLTLEIDPATGPVGQTINAQLPAEAFDPSAGDLCAASATANDLIAEALADFASGLPPEEVLQGVVANILEEAAQGPEFEGTLDSVLFPLVFADVATQEPLSDPSFWDPDTGQGSIVAPGTDVNTGQPLARPSIYAVAATCLGLNEDLLGAAVAGAVAALTELLEAAEAADVTTLLTCLAAATTPEEAEACVAAFITATTTSLEEGVADALAAIVEAAINQDPDIAWAALFCLTGDNFEPCGEETPAAGPAEPVAGVARFTG
jgi:hypothetical protein